MAVTKAPVRQQSYLTEYDRQMAEYLRKIGAGYGAKQIATEAYGGKFPVGTMTAKILSGVLAGASDRRAINREERAKDSYSKAREIAIAMENPRLSTDASTMSVNPNTGNFEYLPTGAKTTSRWGLEDYENEAQKRINAMGNFENLSEADKEKAREVWRTQGPLPETFEASSYSPTGIPYAPKDITEDMRYTVGEKPPEDSTQLGRYLSGTLPQDVLPINAEQALSQALRGANVNEFQFDDYRQNRKLLNAKKPPEYKTMGGELTLYNKNNNQEIRAQRYLVVNSDGTTSNVLMNIKTGKFEQDPNQFTFEKPEEGSFTYNKSLVPLTIVTDDGGILARGNQEFDSNGVPTGYASVDGQRVKVSTLDYNKGATITDALAIPTFETDQRKDYTNASIYKSWGDVKVQIGKLNAIREAQELYENDQNGYIEFVKKDLGLGPEQLKSFDKAIESSKDTLTSQGIFDWASIFLFNKLLDEGSVVRDPEVQQTVDTAGIEGKVVTMFKSLAEGDKIPDEVRRSISIVANTIRNEVETQYLNNAKTTANTIKNWKESNPLLKDLNYAHIIPDWNNIKKEIDPEGLLYNDGKLW
mgnify:CR=1 FL=1